MCGDRVKTVKKLLQFIKKRPFIQAFWTVLTNPHIGNFFAGRIYTGATKGVCVPGLNCYSCPGAAGACPLGALQAQLSGGQKHGAAFYTVGILLLFGALFGRLICGFLCPFGFIQELLNRIPVKKLRVPRRADRVMRYIKYAVLTVFVVILPLFVKTGFGAGVPWFCKLICPAGTLEGGIPLALANGSIRGGLGFLFGWKAALLLAFVVFSVFISRPFCKYICPLGAIYSLFNGVSVYKMKVDSAKCTRCGACAKKCPMDIDPARELDSAECIRCGECKNVCPHGAISRGFIIRPANIDATEVKTDAEDIKGQKD